MTRQRERRCVLCRQTAGEAALLRLVRAPDGRVVADIHEKLPGRGAWVHVDRTALAAALASGMLARALSASWRAAVAPEALGTDLIAAIETGLAERVLARLGLLRRAGRLVLGADAVDAALRGGGVGLLVLARDAGPNTAEKLRRRAAAAGVAVLDCFDRAQLALALGRDNVVQAAATVALEPRFLRDLDRICLWRGTQAHRQPCPAGAKAARKRKQEGGAPSFAE